MNHDFIQREIRLEGLSYLEPVRGDDPQWYHAMALPDGDLFEAEELFRLGKSPNGNRLYLVRYPQGTVYEPLPARPGLYMERPICHKGLVYLLSVDFPAEQIHVDAFDGETTSPVASLPLSRVKNCYNLMLHTHPLTLTRQGNDGAVDIIWPEEVSFSIGPTETLNLRRGRYLCFTAWYEDPDYREETVIRDICTGQEVDRFPGDIQEMPDGSCWRIY